MEVIIDFINSILESVTYEQLMLQKVDNFSKLSILINYMFLRKC